MTHKISKRLSLKSLKGLAALSLLLAFQPSFAQNHIKTNKFAKYNYETGEGVITLESYVTGEKVKETFTKAMDMVLVLDVSNSMCPTNPNDAGVESLGQSVYLFGGDQTGYLHKGITSGTGKTDNNATTHDYKTVTTIGGTKYLRYTVQLGGTGTMYNLAYFVNGTSYKNTTTTTSTKWTENTGWYYGTSTAVKQGGTTSNPTWKAYTPDSSDKIYTDVKLDILENACRSLIDIIYENPATDGNHRISIVTWADNNDGATGINYVNLGLTATTPTNYSTLINSVTFLDTGPNTYAKRGLDKALTNLNGSTGRDKVVLFFTDGEPNNKFADIVNSAKSLKDAGVKVFSVALVDDENKTASRWNTENTMPIKTYLEYVSSLYPNATGKITSNKSTITPGTKNDDGVPYYHWSQTGADLADAFIKIGESVSGGADITDMNSTDDVYVKDKINNDFCELPSGTVASDIKTYTAACNGKSGGELTFGDRAPVSLTVTVDATSIPQSVSVEGFDYSDNWCGADPEAAGGYHGKKLIIEIPFKMKAPGSGIVEIVNTNASGSSIYRGDNAIDGATFISPTIPFTEITIQKTGLKAGESGLYIVKKSGVEIARVVLTGTDGSGSMVSTKLRLLEPLDSDEYSVVETGWDYTYSNLPQSRVGNVFKFTSSKKDGIKNTSESQKVNDFK